MTTDWEATFRTAFEGFKERLLADPAFADGVSGEFLRAYVEDFLDRALRRYVDEEGPVRAEDVEEIRRDLRAVVTRVLEKEFGMPLQPRKRRAKSADE